MAGNNPIVLSVTAYCNAHQLSPPGPQAINQALSDLIAAGAGIPLFGSMAEMIHQTASHIEANEVQASHQSAFNN